MRLLILSPHLDDAVFACGRLLASHPGTAVATVFAGAPPPRAPLTEWDRACGFAPGDDVIGARRIEDREALALLEATPIWLDFSDRQYGASVASADLIEPLDRLFARTSPAAVFFPLGLFHSDHVLVHEAALALPDRRRGMPWFAYEDALYRRIPGALDERVAALEAAGRAPRRVHFLAAPVAAARKRAAVACYRSQLAALATPGRPGHEDLHAPEGYWRIRND